MGNISGIEMNDFGALVLTLGSSPKLRTLAITKPIAVMDSSLDSTDVTNFGGGKLVLLVILLLVGIGRVRRV